MTSGINAEADAAVEAFLTQGRNAMHDITKMVLVEMADRLVYRSPLGNPATWKFPAHKDYHPGLFRNNWDLGVDSLPHEIYDGRDPSGDASRLRIAKAIPRWTLGRKFYFVNNLPYAEALEEGWSPQCPPGGMVALTQMEFESIVRDCETRYAYGERPVRKADL